MNDWSSAGGELVSVGLWHRVTMVTPWVFAALLLFFVLRALLRQRRYSAVGTFSEEDRRIVREAIARAEKKTVGEILPVVVERSDPHPGPTGWPPSVVC